MTQVHRFWRPKLLPLHFIDPTVKAVLGRFTEPPNQRFWYGPISTDLYWTTSLSQKDSRLKEMLHEIILVLYSSVCLCSLHQMTLMLQRHVRGLSAERVGPPGVHWTSGLTRCTDQVDYLVTHGRGRCLAEKTVLNSTDGVTLKCKGVTSSNVALSKKMFQKPKDRWQLGPHG